MRAIGHNSHLIGPIGVAERIELIDVVRGFALYGVLLANLIWISQEGAVTPAQVAALPTAAADRVVRYAVQFFVDWKFYTLFAFLFGLGFSVQLVRAERRGVGVTHFYVRRLGVLLGFGFIHAYLVWYGDILHHYALLGFVLVLFRKCGDRCLIASGFTLGVILPAVVVMGKAVVGPESAPEAPVPADLQTLTARFQAFTSGNYFESLRESAKYALRFWTSGVALHFLPAILGKFLIGFYVGRHRLLEEPEVNLRSFRKLLVWGLILGVVGNTLWVVTTVLTQSETLSPTSVWVLGAQLPIYVGLVAMAAFYLSGFVLLWQKPAWRNRLAHLGPVGRMALTNYLGHSLIYLGVFYGFGLTLLGRVGSTVCLILSVVIFAAQIAFSAWWLRRFRYGPAEWLWRSLTYGTRQPMKISAAQPAV